MEKNTENIYHNWLLIIALVLSAKICAAQTRTVGLLLNDNVQSYSGYTLFCDAEIHKNFPDRYEWNARSHLDKFFRAGNL